LNERWVLPFCSLFSLFLGAFISLRLVGFHHISLFDMLLVIGGSSRTWCSPCGSPS
jgi:hypothetical protein